MTNQTNPANGNGRCGERHPSRATWCDRWPHTTIDGPDTQHRNIAGERWHGSETVTIDGREHTLHVNRDCTDRIDCDTCDVADMDPYQHADIAAGADEMDPQRMKLTGNVLILLLAVAAMIYIGQSL